jgi:Tol biopolymer transport system component
MALAPGTRLGPYEVIGLLGAGGMGEVYRARDTKLNRLIALKRLPTAAAGDADRRDRFAHEAQAIAALNHPNIVTVHSVEQIDDQFCLTMELVEGRSLADVIPATGLPLDRLLAIAIPVVDAIAAAHQRGITHRDLKPANIMIGEGEQAGRIKVLDFGLAKLADAPAAAGVTALPTAPITGEGRILGTVAYMSPEQAEGKAIDARSDLFSFGVMLYEMATGQRPFAGDTNISIISSIIKDTPKSVTDLKPALPRDLARIVRRALLKDPERRYQTAKDLRSDLEELKVALDSGELVSSGATSPTAVRSGVPLWGLAAVGVVAVLAIAASYLLVARRASSGGTARATVSLDDLQITALTTSGNAERPAISPDGKYVAYVQHDHHDYSLWIRQTATPRNVQIVAPEAGVELGDVTVTPDGNYVDFVKQDSTRPVATLWRVAFLGGAPRRIVDDVSSAVGWSPDGRHLAFVRADVAGSTTALVIADSDGSHERVVKTRRLPAFFASLVINALRQRPAWSPDGGFIAVTCRDTSRPNGRQFDIAVIDVTSGTERVLPVEGVVDTIAWLSSDALVASRGATTRSQPQLWRISYPAGQFSRLTNDLNAYRGLDLAADRTSLVTERYELQVGVWVGDAAARAGAEIVPPTARPFTTVAWLRNRLLYASTANRPAPVLLAVDPMSKVAEEITSNAGQPAATADGRTIVFQSVDPGPEGGTLWKTGVDGSHPVRLLEWRPSANPRFALGDRQVVFGSPHSGQQSLWIMPLEGGTPRQLSPMFATASFDVSPDGASVAFVSVKDGKAALMICGLPACVPREIPTAANFSNAPLHWMPDGRAIAYVDSQTQLNLWAQPLDGGPPHLLTHFDDGRTIGNFSWSRDGKNLAVSRVVTTSDIVLVKGLTSMSRR